MYFTAQPFNLSMSTHNIAINILIYKVKTYGNKVTNIVKYIYYIEICTNTRFDSTLQLCYHFIKLYI